jgi:hypothetical protein
LKKTIAIFILVGFFIQTFSSLVIFTDYLLNIENITSKFCENKSKSKLKCNGKCHLKKQLKEQEKQDGSSKSLSKSADESQFYTEYDITMLPQYIYKSNPLNTPYLNGELNSAPLSVFHPPKV